jgi:putative Mg2+ transporter-C (MgtC) family protein
MKITYAEIILRTALALVVGALMGYQRTIEKKPAGIRTHALAAIAGCYVMIVSAYSFQDFPGPKDPARWAAQFISGIGFLGAGVIWKMTEGKTRGLTTAVIVYLTAMFGLGLGMGEYKLTFIAVGFSYIAMNLTPVLVKFGIIPHSDEGATKNEDD